jgi:DinB family protein
MITPDTKDWTWVLDQACPECGYDAAAVEPEQIGERTRSALPRWEAVLRRADVRQRPSDDVWSALEYGCHARDVFAIFGRRLQLMLTTDGAEFDNWDQDVTAVESRYDEQDPAVVAGELVTAGAAIAAQFDAVTGADWDRTARRSDGAVFTTRTFGRYFLHDVEHHLYDVGA